MMSTKTFSPPSCHPFSDIRSVIPTESWPDDASERNTYGGSTASSGAAATRMGCALSWRWRAHHAAAFVGKDGGHECSALYPNMDCNSERPGARRRCAWSAVPPGGKSCSCSRSGRWYKREAGEPERPTDFALLLSTPSSLAILIKSLSEHSTFASVSP